MTRSESLARRSIHSHNPLQHSPSSTDMLRKVYQLYTCKYLFLLLNISISILATNNAITII